MDAKHKAEQKPEPIDWAVMYKATTIADELENYTTAQLVAEINRRRMAR
jgi:hypothetical protein